MADQLGKSVGDMYAGAFIPGFTLTGLYAIYVIIVTIVRPEWAPALRKLSAYAAAVVSKLRSVAPYAVIELVLPGGSLIALALWLYRRQKKIPNFYRSLDALL